MDLRKILLQKNSKNLFLKNTLSESNSSFNSSTASIYESAAEDSDSSLYYSFSNSIKDLNETNPERNIDERENENNESITSSIASEFDNKENTVIMMDKSLESAPEEIKIDALHDINNQLRAVDQADIETNSTNDVVMGEHTGNSAETVPNAQLPIPPVEIRIEDPNQNIINPPHEMDYVANENTANADVVMGEDQELPIPPVEIIIEDPNQNVINPPNDIIYVENENTGVAMDDNSVVSEEDPELPVPPVEIIIEDPNQNIINPFTNAVIEPAASHSTPEAVQPKEVKTKKSASKIPTKCKFYSPVQRKSLDRKAKLPLKPVMTRRTIFEPRKSPISKPKPPPAKSLKSIALPVKSVKLIKCTFAGCLREFRTQKLLQDHLKFHNPLPSTSSVNSFKCKYCDKVFNLNGALTNHFIENCTKIPFADRRKIIIEENQKKEEQQTSKRRTIFAAPAPQRKSPNRRQTLNKSGIRITPKKSLKCHEPGCGQIFLDVVEFANHTVNHKYAKALHEK